MTTTTGQRKRTKGWRMQEGDICVTRPGPWGNWWRIIPDDSGERVGWWVHCDLRPDLKALFFAVKKNAAATAVDLFRWDVSEDGPNSEHPRVQWVRDHAHDLRGHRLLCWCAEGDPCHRDVLAALADA